MFIDTHCHIHFGAYDDNREEVIAAAREKGVKMIAIGTQSSTSKSAIALADEHDDIWATVGLHPNQVHEQSMEDGSEPEETSKVKTRGEAWDYEHMKELANSSNKVVAIGECGLDYFRIPENRDVAEVKAEQKEVFRSQLDLADELDLPVVIHVRDAHADTQEILKEYLAAGKLSEKGVVHCFTGSADDVRAYSELGFCMAINGIMTFSKELAEVVKSIPKNLVILETDAPYLAPVPHRGKVNEPSFIPDIANFYADLTGAAVEEVAAITTENAKRLFGLHV